MTHAVCTIFCFVLRAGGVHSPGRVGQSRVVSPPAPSSPRGFAGGVSAAALHMYPSAPLSPTRRVSLLRSYVLFDFLLLFSSLFCLFYCTSIAIARLCVFVELISRIPGARCWCSTRVYTMLELLCACFRGSPKGVLVHTWCVPRHKLLCTGIYGLRTEGKLVGYSLYVELYICADFFTRRS